ncbi:MAG: HNH endonuclease, partial [Clostridia bacterium]|nr:HNH endonuclease [Clostridia bacterium]
FEKPDDLVRLIRYDYMSRQKVVTNRGLYKAIQDEIEAAHSVTPYLKELEKSLKYFKALKEPDDALWSSIHVEVKDSLLAFRRFGFDSNMPLLLAAFKTWPLILAANFVSTVAAWSIRAWFAGTLGGGVAESAFSEAAVAITSKNAHTARDVLDVLDARDLVPTDSAFRQSILNSPPISTTRAKYLLATLERQYAAEHSLHAESLPDWSSKAITIEHIFKHSSKRSDFNSDADFENFEVIRDQLGNFTLLERTLNNGLEDKPVLQKLPHYLKSGYNLTKLLGGAAAWSLSDARQRHETLADLAIRAWPREP